MRHVPAPSQGREISPEGEREKIFVTLCEGDETARIFSYGDEVGHIRLILLGSQQDPGAGVVQDGLDELGVEIMPRFVGDNMTDDVSTQERHVSDEV